MLKEIKIKLLKVTTACVLSNAPSDLDIFIQLASAVCPCTKAVRIVLLYIRVV